MTPPKPITKQDLAAMRADVEAGVPMYYDKKLALLALVERQQEEIAYAACVFETYVGIHSAKGASGRVKAAVNQVHADRMRAALLPDSGEEESK